VNDELETIGREVIVEPHALLSQYAPELTEKVSVMTSSIERPIWDHPHTSRNTDHSAAILDDSLFKREAANLSVQDLKGRNSEAARLDCCS
jgi:hypothetical protein